MAVDIIGNVVATVPVAVEKVPAETGSGNRGATPEAVVIAVNTVVNCAKILPVTFTPILLGGANGGGAFNINVVCIVVIDVTADDKAVTAGATATG